MDANRSLSDPKTWRRFFFDTPCVKSSYLWGLGIGSVMFAHKLRIYPGKLRSSFNAAFFTFLVSSTVSFVFCSGEVNRKKKALRNPFRPST